MSFDQVFELAVGHSLVFVLKGDRIRELRDRVEHDVDQGARLGRLFHRVNGAVFGYVYR